MNAKKSKKKILFETKRYVQSIYKNFEIYLECNDIDERIKKLKQLIASVH